MDVCMCVCWGGGGECVVCAHLISCSSERNLSLSGGVTPCRHLRPSSGREHTIV